MNEALLDVETYRLVALLLGAVWVALVEGMNWRLRTAHAAVYESLKRPRLFPPSGLGSQFRLIAWLARLGFLSVRSRSTAWLGGLMMIWLASTLAWLFGPSAGFFALG